MMIDILRRTNKQHIDHGTLPNTRARTQKLSFSPIGEIYCPP